MQEAAIRNFEKWFELGVSDYSTSVSDFKTFVNTRLTWMDANIVSIGATIPLLQINDTTLCSGELISAYIGDEYSYKWNTGDTNSIFAPTETDSYQLKVNDVYGCSASAQINITVNSLPNPIYTAISVGELNYQFLAADSTFVSYLWNFGTSAYDTVKTPNYTYDSAGIYYTSLTVIDTNGCGKTKLDSLVISISGMGQNKMSGVTILPNPFHDFVTIIFLESNEVVSLQLTSIIGKEIYHTEFSTSTTIKTDLLSTGIYFITLNG